jgi:lipopolysaccharide transport system ATP-binding protein
MSFDDMAISVRGVSKHYLLFARPEHRLKQSVLPRLQRLVRRPQRQYYRDFRALSDVSFDVRRGETVGIIGRNGCGKSTLLRVICGILQPTSGSVSVRGRIAALLELGSGFNREFTGRENVYVNGAILGISRAEMTARFDAIARFADIGDFIDQPVKTYSSGMQLRLAFATAINVDPDILVIDEALAVGDEAFKRKCYARIEEIKKKGSTILFVSHSHESIVRLCTRAVLLDRGELLLHGTPKTVVHQYQRLLNASPESAPQIRKEILAMRGTEAVAAVSAVPTPTEAGTVEKVNGAATAGTVLSPLGSSSEPGDFYVSDFKPQTTVHLEERGARIRDARILALDGRQVNMLKLGNRYAVEYCVEFTQAAIDVDCEVAFRTTEGVRVATANTARVTSLRIQCVEPGQAATVRMEFSCLMLPRPYFITCAVRGSVNSERIVMNSVIDALMLRVLPEKDILSGGLFDISPSVTISLAGTGGGAAAMPNSAR